MKFAFRLFMAGVVDGGNRAVPAVRTGGLLLAVAVGGLPLRRVVY